MDDQIDLTKEFLHLAWQIANGMVLSSYFFPLKFFAEIPC